MLAGGLELLEEARQTGRAVAGFATYTLESTRAICEAAEERGRPVLLHVSEGAFQASSFATLSAVVLAAARESSVPVGVHLDHARELELVESCLELGYTSVMIDGSALSYEENVAISREAADRAHRAGAWCEAELGPIAGDEHSSSDATTGALTDADEAARFADETDIDVLAAAVGTVHGRATTAMPLDVGRIGAIVAASGLPFCLHGASGLGPDELADAIGAGTVKVNLNTELRRAYLNGVAASIGWAGDDVTAVMTSSTDAVRAVTLELLGALEGRREAIERGSDR